jgi:hypothetical protein
MNVAVVIPYHDFGDEHRARSFRFVRRWWVDAFPHADFIIADPPEFTRARALNYGIQQADPDAMILHSDPDSIVAPAQAVAALELAESEDGLVVASNHAMYLNQEKTEWARNWGGIASAFETLTDADCEWAGPGAVSNVTAFTRQTWEAAGGYDERFGVWGGDDACYAFAAHWLVAPMRRVPGPVWHLWHPRPPESIPGHPEYLRQHTIIEGYRDAQSADDIFKILAARR